VGTQVLTKRNSLGIAPFRVIGPKKWNQKAIRLLGRKSDQEVAEMLGMAKTTVANKRRSLGIESFAHKTKLWRRWTEDELALLGKHTDKEIARRLKMPEPNVASKRHHLGIAPFRPRKENTRPRPNAVKWTRQNLALLGKLPDAQVCGIMGVSHQSPPISPPCGPPHWLFQEPPAKSKFLAVARHRGKPVTQGGA
jgi:DNA-binding CsgD family transcriptional regulator